MDDPGELSLYELPYGVLETIANILMVTAPATLVGAVTQLGTRMRIICHKYVTLRLEGGWFKPTSNVSREDCISEIRWFGWIDALNVHVGELLQIFPTGAAPTTLKKLELFGALPRGVRLSDHEDKIRELAASCPLLEEFCAYTVHITHEQLSTLTAEWRNLKTLTIGDSNTTDDTISAIAASCPSLEGLWVTYCKNLTDKALFALAGGRPALEGGCPALAGGCPALAGGCPALKYLDAEYAHKITTVGVEALAGGCPALKTLDVRHAKGIADTALVALADGCPLLEELDVASAETITDTGVRALAAGCPRLQTLGLMEEGMGSISGAALEELQVACPGIDVVFRFSL